MKKMFGGTKTPILSRMGDIRKTMSDPEESLRASLAERGKEQGRSQHRRRTSAFSEDGSKQLGLENGDLESGVKQPLLRPTRQVSCKMVLWAMMVLLVTGLLVQKQVSLRTALQTCSKSSESLRQEVQELHQRAKGTSNLMETKSQGAAFTAWGDDDMASKMGEKILQLEAELKEVHQRLASSEGQLAMYTLAKGKVQAPPHATQASPKTAAPAKATKSGPKHARSH